MAFRKTLAQRLFCISKMASPALTNCHITSLSSLKTLVSQNPAKAAAPDPGEDGFFRRVLQKRWIFQPALSSEVRSRATGEGLMEKLKVMDIARDRLRLEGLVPPTARSEGITVEDARKVLRLAQLGIVKSKLREIRRSRIPYEEFVQICANGCSSRDDGVRFAKMLDESGSVIILGNVVFLRPDEVVKAMANLIAAQPKDDPRSRKELEEMEKQEAAIDKKAELAVRRELWAGLGLFVVQTLGFMRLTFWELSWDVMEPICFYVTSTYFVAGYAFFLRTSREPTFESFFHSRLAAKRKRLMKINKFDIARYNELRRACNLPQYGDHDASSSTTLSAVHHH
ncbi:calcium uniporter protein 2, mitochondrial-like [Malania oleifera]|uniref:calcium uniporter protein 2, mitochondrial-like n=1 Tax=Malania oleifera TaxID=397392 RepID=UPI0025AECC9E|nr:calcium uniporter protein 2, mitochondrial-like [Malania oleifera]